MLKMSGLLCYVDPLGQLSTEECFSDSFGGHFKDMISVLELHRAAEMIIHQDEPTLEKLSLWSEDFMRAKILAGDSSTVPGKIYKEVKVLMLNFQGSSRILTSYIFPEINKLYIFHNLCADG